ncbi:TPA: VCBS repeat-containing protein, partial [Thermoplasmata archaeon]|nr:VCBS repeat-containing protein [Thermoplasmata archaeon]
MHRFSATTLVVVIVASLLVPLAISQAYPQGALSSLQNRDESTGFAFIESVQFLPSIDTSSTVPEYPMISRALMLDGGSTDVVLGDVTKDGFVDLVVGVGGETPSVSVFEGDASGSYLTYASYNISLSRIPVSVSLLDAEGAGELQIAVLERRASDLEVDRIEIFDFNSTVSVFESFLNEPRYVSYENASMLVTGNLTGDSAEDIAAVCMGGSPSSTPGFVELFRGPNFLSPDVFGTGRGSSAACVGDFNDDGDADLAVSNYFDYSVMVFYQPFTLGMSPDLIVNIDGLPTSLASGRLNADEADDLLVTSVGVSAIHFFMQSLGQIPTLEDYNRSLDYAPSNVNVDDLDGDGRHDILILSAEANAASGFIQRSTSPIWRALPDFVFPTGSTPRGSLIADLNGDTQTDIAVASAREDWNGSSLSLYTSNAPYFSNSNLTVWAYPVYPASAVSAGDLDGDDWEDLVLLYPDLDGFGYLQSFTGTTTTIALGYEPSLLLIEDFDGDGFDDVMTASRTEASFTINFGDSTLPDGFTTEQYDCDQNATAASAGDFNTDGLLDLVLSTDDGEILVFFNSGDEEVFGESTVLSVSPGTP